MPDPDTKRPPAEFTFVRRGRSATAVLATGGWLLGLLGLWFWLKATPLVLAVLALPVLPALLDLIRNPGAGLRITSRQIEWHSGRLSGAVRLDEIDHLRIDTRWDFSKRATLVLTNGTRIRLPQEATAPDPQLETALSARAVPCKRHHFAPF